MAAFSVYVSCCRIKLAERHFEKYAFTQLARNLFSHNLRPIFVSQGREKNVSDKGVQLK
jgi:hypothetical protein